MLKSFAIRHICWSYGNFSNQLQLHTRGIGLFCTRTKTLHPILACLLLATFFAVKDFKFFSIAFVSLYCVDLSWR